ncbi:hypothetical protein ACOT81_32615 [Streptomyces sp. WI04-05B]|uniref:hypothetical protein n=1 Tax=Streptomyces TaxID=1883 RepID=UPI0029AB33C0|nr:MULTISPECIES: hypothetical protein [unclassified Streptomyces]MDX2547318.1 hypothetical protein [Streptomyces sp. WI04-05B]MDX2589806.1 hypothetical protein [Streptomyces sp. WI04-05A]MDX3753457.1 hypothetical protein [Streptomyces sp. AK08-02]
MNRSICRAVTVFAVLFPLIGLGATASAADEPVSAGAVVSEVTQTVLSSEAPDSMVWD